MAQPARTAIVTGGGKRIGRFLVDALLADGWTVVAHVRRDGDPVPDGAHRVACDLTQADSADLIFAAAVPHGPVTLLVNCASRFAFDGFGAFDASEFDRHMATNVRAPLALIERLAAQAPADGALAVNLLDAKLSAPNPDFLSYTLSKQALAGATGLAARALAGRGVRVNGIAPALMLPSPGQSAENFGAMHAHNPLRRGVEPGDVVAALRYLIAVPAVTGEILTIDGGQKFMGLERDVQFLGWQ